MFEFLKQEEKTTKEKINELNYLISTLKNSEVKFNLIVNFDDYQINISDASSKNLKVEKEKEKKEKKQ